MKISKELKNGFLIFIGIGIFFLLMEVLKLSNLYFLRLFNVVIVVYGLNRTIKANIEQGDRNFLTNFISAGLTGAIGVILSIIGLAIYITIRGGSDYLANLSDSFIYGKTTSIAEYCMVLSLEGMASVLIVVFATIHYWKTKDSFKEYQA